MEEEWRSQSGSLLSLFPLPPPLPVPYRTLSCFFFMTEYEMPAGKVPVIIFLPIPQSARANGEMASTVGVNGKNLLARSLLSFYRLRFIFTDAQVQLSEALFHTINLEKKSHWL